MKKVFNVLMILCAGLFVLACSNKAKSYTDMLKAEKKAINKLIGDEDFEIIKRYPENGVFGDKQFFKLDNGVYLNVIDSGNGTRAVAGKTRVFCRFTANRIMLDSVILSNYNEAGTYPVVFKYNGAYSSIEAGSSISLYQEYLEGLFSEGLLTGLQYVGDQGKVKLIVPFKVGSTTDMQNGWPVYFEIVQFKFEE